MNVRATRLTSLSTSAAAGMLLWISRTVLALLVSYPLLAAVRASGMIAGPEGDSVLFQPGSLLLLELLRVGAPWLSSAAELSLILLAVAAIFQLIPLAVALDLLSEPDRPLLERGARALRIFPRFIALGMITLLAQAALLLAASLLGAALKPALASADERVRSIAPLALMGLGLVACAWFGGALDIARATLVRRNAADGGARAALAQAVDCLRQRPMRVLLGVYPSVAGSALAVLAATWFLARFVPTQATGRALTLAFAAHQLAMVFAIAWRVRWLGAALELSAEGD